MQCTVQLFKLAVCSIPILVWDSE